MLLAEAFFAGCWWLRFRWLLVAGAYAPLATGGFTSAGNWWPHFRWHGCWWLGFRWLLVAPLPLVAGAYAPPATGGFTSAGNALVCGFFTGLSSQ